MTTTGDGFKTGAQRLTTLARIFVPAALIAAVKLIASRISPTMMMSGSCRRTCFRA